MDSANLWQGSYWLVYAAEVLNCLCKYACYLFNMVDVLSLCFVFVIFAEAEQLKQIRVDFEQMFEECLSNVFVSLFKGFFPGVLYH